MRRSSRKEKRRYKGERYRPDVRVDKVNKGMPTKVTIEGREYAYVHPQYINGRKGLFK